MNFNYNSHLDYEDRAVLVASEILEEYPLIKKKEALLVAFSLASIDDKVTDEQKFLRYYYILRTIKRNHDEFPHVFNDLYNLYDTGLSSPLFRNTMERIIAYANGVLDEFPEILEESG